MRVAVISTPVAPLGSAGGAEGGITLLLRNLAATLKTRGHHLTILAPAGSRLDAPCALIPVEGALHVPAQHQDAGAEPIEPPDSVLAAMWTAAERLQDDVDVLLNLAYDQLPFDRAPRLARPVAHFVSMSSVSTAMANRVRAAALERPGTVAMQTRAQASSFGLDSGDVVLLGGGVDVAAYPFAPGAVSDAIAWAGRVAPEKGLDDAVRIAALAGRPLRVMGAMQDPDCWRRASDLAAGLGVDLRYEGFLPTPDLASALGQCRCLLVTPRWVEAFGLVVVEALACGLPVVAYRRGGPAEIVDHGVTGFLVDPGDLPSAAAAVSAADALDRARCRLEAERRFDASTVAGRAERWLRGLVEPTTIRQLIGGQGS